MARSAEKKKFWQLEPLPTRPGQLRPILSRPRRDENDTKHV